MLRSARPSSGSSRLSWATTQLPPTAGTRAKRGARDAAAVVADLRLQLVSATARRFPPVPPRVWVTDGASPRDAACVSGVRRVSQREMISRLGDEGGARHACKDEMLRPWANLWRRSCWGHVEQLKAPKCTAVLRMVRGQGAVPHAILHESQCNAHTHVHRHRPTLPRTGAAASPMGLAWRDVTWRAKTQAHRDAPREGDWHTTGGSESQ